MSKEYMTVISCRTKEGMSYCMAKLPGPKMIPGAEGVQRSVELAVRQQYLRSWKQVPTPSHALGDHLLNKTGRRNSVMENSASKGNGEREDVEENSRKVKSQRLPAVSSSQDVVDTAGDVEDGSCTVKPQGLPAVSPSQDVVDTAGDVDNSSMLKPQRLPAVSPSQDVVDTAGDVDDSSMLKPQELPPVRPFEVSPFQDVVDTEGDVKDDPLKVKSQRSPTESLFEMNPSHVVETDTPTAEKRWHSERSETECSRGTRRVYRSPTSKYPLHGGIDLSSAPFSSSKNDSDPDSSMVFSSAVSTGEDLLRPDDVTVGLTYQSSPLSTSALSKSSAGCSREDECHHSEDEAVTRTQGIAGLSASLLCWMTTRVAQTTTTTRTSLNSLDATSPPSSTFSSRDSSGLNSHGCSEASPISCPSDFRPVSNSSTRRADFLGGLSRRLSWGWGWGRGRGRGKSGAFFTLSHGEVVEGGGAGGSRGSGKDTAMVNNNATSGGKLSVPRLTSTSCVSEAVETWGKKNANSSSSPPPPSPASRSDAMTTRKATILESSTALVAPPSSPVEAATVTTVADPSVPSAHVSGVYSRTIKRRRIGVVGSGIVVRAESTDSSASETLSSIRRKKSIAADNSAPKAPKAAKEGQYPRAYHLSFC